MTSFEKRLTPARPDLAAVRLEGVVAAARYVAPRLMQVASPVADLRRAPSPEASLDTQALAGERVDVYEVEEGWAWGQLRRDGYVGYLAAADLTERVEATTHRVATRATFLYPAPDIKTPRLDALPLGAEIRVEEMRGQFARTARGFVFATHLVETGARVADFVAVAEAMIGTPYLWGGRTPAGLDCSGLVQMALGEAGFVAPRDTDMQENALGRSVVVNDRLEGLARGDLVFWKGHVGVMRDPATLLHANGFHMLVASERLRDAAHRIAASGAGPITSIKRISLPPLAGGGQGEGAQRFL